MFRIDRKMKHFAGSLGMFTFLLVAFHCVHGLSISSDLEIDTNHHHHHHQPITIEAGSVLRVPRDVNNINSTNIPTNLTDKAVKFVNLNDSHEQLTVHWAGKNSPVIICLAKNRPISRRGQSSAVYISRDYGETFDKITLFKLRNNSDAIIDSYQISPVLNSFYLFIDATNKCLFITKDFGQTFQRIDLPFKPKSFLLHHSMPNLILATAIEGNSTSYTLYVSETFGLTWRKIQEGVNFVSWSIENVDDDMKKIYVQRVEPNGLSTIISSNDFFSDKDNLKVWLNNVDNVSINGRFIFVTRHVFNWRSDYQLWISVDRRPFFRAIIPLTREVTDYYIADVTSETIFLCVNYKDDSAHLFTSDMNFETFTLSLDNVVYYNDKNNKARLPGARGEVFRDQEFLDLHRVAGIRGIYIVSKFRDGSDKLGLADMMSLITFDMGNKWHKLKRPPTDLGSVSIPPEASLHLAQKYYMWTPVGRPILTRESVPGFIMASGVVGTSFKGKQNIYLSIDAGMTWRQVLSGNYLYAFGDFGSVIVAVEHHSRGGSATNKLLYSLNDGKTFHELVFSPEKIRVYGLQTEPGEKTTIFTLFGSKEKNHEWNIISVNFTSFFHNQCEVPFAYKEWSPHDFESGCLLGSTQIFQRRVSELECYHGEEFRRPVSKINCPCKHYDFECDVGFTRDKNSSTRCVPDDRLSSLGFNRAMIPADCEPGKLFNKTRGYRKINGDTCEGGEESWYSPQLVACPFTPSVPEFMLFVQRVEISMISLNNEQFTKSTLIPSAYLHNAIAADFDRENKCIFWSDISMNKILRMCLDGKQVQAEVLVEANLFSVEGIVFNQINHHLYFVNGNRSKIEVIRTNIHYEGRMRRTIIQKPDIENPRGIALDPYECYLFVTDWSTTKPGIIRSELDGENLKVLFNQQTVIWPNGITTDHKHKRIYWVDAKLDYVASSDYDGQGLTYILQSEDHAPHPFALGVFKDFIFYDDWNLQKIFLISKTNQTHRKTIMSDAIGAMDLKIITPLLSPNATNICNKNDTCEHLCIAKPYNSYRCLCPDGLVSLKQPDGNEKCTCPTGKELTKTGACRPISPEMTCMSTDFTCDNGNCISKHWMCDGDDDCGDRSDEKICTDRQCKSNWFQCKVSGKCILDIFVCDFQKDCDDGSDEDYDMCEATYPICSRHEFTCRNHRCIPKAFLCDLVDHCKDGSDEIDCSTAVVIANLPDQAEVNRTLDASKTTPSPPPRTITNPPDQKCTANQFECSVGGCINKIWRCDGHQDCSDGSDEDKCSIKDCGIDEFWCAHGSCIQSAWRCDGEPDCRDGSDERNCTGHAASDSKPIINHWNGQSCPRHWYICNDGKCIPFQWHCDGNEDCVGGDDEAFCLSDNFASNRTNSVPAVLQPNVTCGEDKFLCYKTNQCIFAKFICDGDKDCELGEDELNCKSSAEPKCASNQYACLFSQACIPLKQICDGESNCADASDEWNCENVRYRQNSMCLGFTCKSGECIHNDLRCDKKQDCLDGSDEKNCHETVFAVKDLHVNFNTITSHSFSVSWKSPDPTLSFKYLPSYSVNDNENELYNATWIKDTNYTFVNLHSGYTYKVFVFVLLNRFKKEGRVFTPNTFIKVTTAAVAPNPPTKLRAKEIGFNRVLVSWATPANFTEPLKGYKVYYSPPQPAHSQMLDYKTNQIELFGFFQIGVEYTFWVTTLTRNLESLPSNEVKLVIGPVTTIKDLRQVNVTNSSVLLQWVSSPDRVHKWFISYICYEYFPAFRKNTTVYGKDRVFVSELSPGVNYQFRINPVVNNTIIYHGIQDNFIEVKTLGRQLPTVDMINSTIRGSVASLSWQPPAKAANYNGQPNIIWEYAVYVGLNARSMRLYARTRDTRIVLKNLFSCEIYLVQIRVIEPFGLGPADYEHFIKTEFDPISPPKKLRYEVGNEALTKYNIHWQASCTDIVLPQKVGYIVRVVDTVEAKEDRFRFHPNTDFEHSFVLHVHYGAMYEIQVSTDHPDARWSSRITLQTQPMPRPLRPFAYITRDRTQVVVVWKTIDNFPQDDQEHKLKYKISISNSENDTDKGDTVLVESPPAKLKPSFVSFVYYINVQLVDNHGYVSAPSPTYKLSTEIYLENNLTIKVRPHPLRDAAVFVLLLTSVALVALFIVTKFYKNEKRKAAALYPRGHYNSRLERATLHTAHNGNNVGNAAQQQQPPCSHYDNIDDDCVNVYGDDHPLVRA